MTREEAVLILDPDNSEAALARLEYYAGFGGEEAELRIIRDACRLAVKALRETGAWVSVDEHFPPEHDSIFKKFEGTDKWVAGMFESLSDDVIVSVKFEDGTKKTYSAHTIDGVWSGLPKIGHPVVTHWMPFPKPTEEG